jgi:hypothetical protein
MLGDKTCNQQKCPLVPLQVATPINNLQVEILLYQPVLPASDKDSPKIIFSKFSTSFFDDKN